MSVTSHDARSNDVKGRDRKKTLNTVYKWKLSVLKSYHIDGEDMAEKFWTWTEITILWIAHHRLAKTGKISLKQRNLKQLAIIAYDNRGVLSKDFIPISKTINVTYYAQFLEKELRPAIQK